MAGQGDHHAEGPRYSRPEEAHHEHDKKHDEWHKHLEEAHKHAESGGKHAEEHHHAGGAVAHGGYSHGEHKEGEKEHHEHGQEARGEEHHAKEQGKSTGGVAHGGFYHGQHKPTANVTRNGTIAFHAGNWSHDGKWSNGTAGDHEIKYPHQGNLSLHAVAHNEHHNALAAVGGAAVVAALGFVAFKVAKKLRQRASYESIPSEGARLI